MFGLFKPKCPVPTSEKLGVEYNLALLSKKLGFDRVRSCEIILPDKRYFPDPYRQTYEDVVVLMKRVCGYLKIDPNRIDLQIVEARGLDFAVERPADSGFMSIHLTKHEMIDAERAVASLAYLLGQVVLHDLGELPAFGENLGVLELVPTLLGVGIFSANSTLREVSHTRDARVYRDLSRQGELSADYFGYALAVLAYFRREYKPTWIKHLRPDASSACKRGLKYLDKTGDTLFHPDRPEMYLQPPTLEVAIGRLKNPSATIRAATFYELTAINNYSDDLLDAIIPCLKDQDVTIRYLAAWLLSAFGTRAGVAHAELWKCLESDSPDLRACAVWALAETGVSAELFVPELIRLLGDTYLVVRSAAVTALGMFASYAIPAVPKLVELMRKSVNGSGDTSELADVIVAIQPSAEMLAGLLATIDDETREVMEEALHEAKWIALDRTQNSGDDDIFVISE